MQPESAFHVPAGLMPSQPASSLFAPTVQNQLPIPSAHNAASSSTSAPAMSSATLTLGSGIEESRKPKEPGKTVVLPFGFIMLLIKILGLVSA